MRTTRTTQGWALRMLLSAAVPIMTAIAQPPPPPPGVPLPVTQSLAGTVSQYLMNPHGEVDGLLLSDGTQVHFPPHMSADLTQTVKPRDKVSAQGERENGVAFHAFSISNTTTGRTVVESRPSQFPRPLPPDLRGMELKPLQARGNIKAVLVAPRGESDGAVLEDGTIIRIPPHVGMQFSGLLRVGQFIAANGYGTQNQFGRCLEATEIGASVQSLTPVYGVSSPGPVAPPQP